MRAPDVAFVSAGRVTGEPAPGFAELAPDLVVEVVSPSDRASEVSATAAEWLDAGVRLAWVVDPQARLATVHRADGRGGVVRRDGAVDGEGVLPGFRLPLAPIFG